SEYTSLQIGWIELRVRLEVQNRVTPLLALSGPHKRVGENAKELGCLFVVVLTVLVLLGLSACILPECFHFLTLFSVTERLPIALDGPLNCSRVSLSHPLLHRFLRFRINFKIQPVGMIVAARFKLRLDGLLNDLLRILCVQCCQLSANKN